MNICRLSIVAVLLVASCGGDAADPRDPDRAVAGGGVLVPGWSARLDDPEASLDDVRFVEIDGGYEVRVGPNVVLWKPANRAEGGYRLWCEVTHLDSHDHAHGAGLVFGGNDLDGEAQAYSYFLVHGDGEFLVKRRDGADTTEIAPWTAHEAVRKEDENGVARNVLAVEVGAEDTAFLVNGTEVHRAPNDALHTDGVFGLRLVHNLDVRFMGLSAKSRE